ncbi:MAG: 2Fe-2S iron-sulfur cluster-binding protein [Anaerolineales bacterium]|nr:2Fe-2S iron-sulfur cluster-binding protein [Anaerolineales bacterium]
MADLKVEGYGTFEVPEGKRLLKAIEDSGVDILHRCGGNARCTTCRVEFYAGEPQRMTTAEFMRLEQEGLLGEARLSCQCKVEGDMHLKPLKTVSNSEHSEPGSEPEDEITPEPEWVPLDEIPM